MRIFEKRPLSLILCIMLGGFSVFSGTKVYVRLITAALSLILFSLSFIRRWFNKKSADLIRIICIPVFLSMLLSILWTSTFFPREYFDQEADIIGQVKAIERQSNGCKITLRTDTINERSEEYTLLAYYYGNNNEIDPGDTIRLRGIIEKLDNTDTLDPAYLYSDGISATVYGVANIYELKNGEGSPAHLFTRLRSTITELLIKKTDRDTGGFISALLIGNRTHLSDNTSLNFRRIGISHILALSGMHLSILMHSIERLLNFLRFGKKLRISITVVITVLYMSLVGFTPSITRAGLMLIIYYSLYLMSRSRDGFTSLCISVFLIVLFSPHSIYDISLWLSSFATLGIIILAELTPYVQKNDIVKRLIKWIVTAILSSVLAIGCTILITSLSFDTISLLSIVSTIVFSPLAELLIYLGIGILFVGDGLGIGKAAIWLCDVINDLAEAFSSQRWVLASSNSPGTKILIVAFTVFLFAFLVLKVRAKGIAVGSLTLMLLVIYLSCALTTFNARNGNIAEYHTDMESETLLLRDEGDITLFSPAEFSYDEAYYVLNLATEECITAVDALIISGYGTNTDEALEALMRNIELTELYLPSPATKGEILLARSITSIASIFNIKCTFYEAESIFSVGQISFEQLSRATYEDQMDKGSYATVIEMRDEKAAIISGAVEALSIPVRKALSNCDTLILSIDSTQLFNMEFPKIRRIIAAEKSVFDEKVYEAYLDRGVIATESQHCYTIKE